MIMCHEVCTTVKSGADKVLTSASLYKAAYMFKDTKIMCCNCPIIKIHWISIFYGYIEIICH